MAKAITLFGWVLIALSPLPWLAIIALPFMGMSLQAGAIWAVGLVVASDVLFFSGAAIVGPHLYRRRHAIWSKLKGLGSSQGGSDNDRSG